MNLETKASISPKLEIETQDENFEIKLKLIDEVNHIFTYSLNIHSEKEEVPNTITVKWKIPAINIKGVWKPGAIYNKRLQYDWELNHLESRVSVDAPIINVFGFADENVITLACSDAVNMIEMNTLLREEDNHIYCHITFFKERFQAIKNYEAQIRIDLSNITYSKAIENVSSWWELFDNLKPSPVPDLARVPLYSTWYQFHQELDESVLIEECTLAVDLGYKLIILDDGWQTLDINRGYDYTGDWEPDRFPNLKGMVKKIHDTGMKFGLWFSVPFCGVKSKAYQKFKGKFLTENHRWAPVFDPRYPEVRDHLIQTYCNALINYDLDAFKLDFIDDFKVYPETDLTNEDGRDYANVNEAVDRLMTDVMNSLWQIKPNIAIEFRQQYIGPAMRKFGNMFRAFDCPNDPVTNRIRTTDIKMLAGNTAVHSDMLTWHSDEKVEISALQVLNAIFSVPQMSVHLRNLSKEHTNMLRFYTDYWIQNKSLLLDGEFLPASPLSNYPTIKVSNKSKSIIAVYEESIIKMGDHTETDILNAKRTSGLVLRNKLESQNYTITIWDCQGQLISENTKILTSGVNEIQVPISGLCRIQKN